ncbi:MAG: ABC transporter substrate-binding protein [Desulfomonilia bacterium]
MDEVLFHDRSGHKHLQGAPVRFTDAAGREVSLSAPALRIVVVGTGPFMVLHLLYMFPEAVPRIVGMEERAKLSAFIHLVDPDFSSKTILKPNPGPEQIAAIRPDVVLMKGSAVNQTCTSLERLGIKVAYIGMENPEQFFTDLDNLGLMLGNTPRAEEIKAYYRSRLELVDTRLEGIPERDKPRLLVVGFTERGGAHAIQVPAASWMQTLQAWRAGTVPVWVNSVTRASDSWNIVNFEQVAAWNPDIISVIVPHSIRPEELMARLARDPQWRLLKAVRADRLYPFPSDLYGWDSPEPRWILGLLWTARTAHPGRFADIDMRDETVTYFRKLYGMETSLIEERILSECPAINGEEFNVRDR